MEEERMNMYPPDNYPWIWIVLFILSWEFDSGVSALCFPEGSSDGQKVELPRLLYLFTKTGVKGIVLFLGIRSKQMRAREITEKRPVYVIAK